MDYSQVIQKFEDMASYYEKLEFEHLAALFREGAAALTAMKQQLDAVTNPPIK